MSSSQNIEMVLDNFTDGKAKYYFPETVTVDEYVDMFLEYAEMEHASLNYLRLVRNSPAGLNKFINLTVKQKVILKERVDVLNKEVLENGTTWTRKLGVFSDRYEYDMFNGDKVFLDVKDIKQYVSDPATLLNFINSLDGLWTGGRILNLPSFVNLESNVFERNFGIRSKNHYEETSALGIKLDLVLQQIRINQHVLGEEGTSIERVLDFFFGEYSKEIGVDWLSVEFPKVGEIRDRNSALFPTEENIRKQWQVLVENGQLTIDFFGEMEKAPAFAELPSLLKQKYAYPTEQLSLILKDIFSDQSLLTYVDDEFNGSTFIDLISKKEVSIQRFHEYQKPAINRLVEESIVTIEPDTQKVVMTIEQQEQLLVLMDFWFYGVVNTWSPKWNADFQINATGLYANALDRLNTKGLIRYGNTLYSEPEEKYLDYLLNKKQFDNALGIRNGYAHGKIASEGEYLHDYYVALLVILIDVVKMNEELHYVNLERGGRGFYMV